MAMAMAASGQPDPAAARRQYSATLPPLVEQVMALLKTTGRGVAAGREIISEGRPYSALFLVEEGVAIRYRILRDGQRQIINVLLPGDFGGVSNCRFETALFSIKTLTHSIIHPIPLARLAALIDSEPRLGTQLLWSFANDTAIVAEHLIAIGRRAATERLAHFLLELLTRLKRLGLAENNAFRLPLTQEIIGDALGLSVPYVNRVLHQLQDEGLIRVKNQHFEIRNVEELTALADFKQDYLLPRLMPESSAVPN